MAGCEWFSAGWLYSQSTALSVHHFTAQKKPARP